jgi:hypothetical protein
VSLDSGTGSTIAVETTICTEFASLEAAGCESTELDENDPDPLLTTATDPCLRTARGLGTRYRRSCACRL